MEVVTKPANEGHVGVRCRIGGYLNTFGGWGGGRS